MKLNAEQQKTLDLQREKGVAGMRWYGGVKPWGIVGEVGFLPTAAANAYACQHLWQDGNICGRQVVMTKRTGYVSIDYWNGHKCSWWALCRAGDELAALLQAHKLLGNMSCKTCGERDGDQGGCPGDVEQCVNNNHENWGPG